MVDPTKARNFVIGINVVAVVINFMIIILVPWSMFLFVNIGCVIVNTLLALDTIRWPKRS